MNSLFKQIPSVDKLLSKKFVKELTQSVGQKITYHAIQTSINQVRELIKTNKINDNIENTIEEKIKTNCIRMSAYSLRKVINATGIIIHTNLGRAVISKEVAKHIIDIATNYSNLEYNLETGKRGHRDSHAEKLISIFFNVESACLVNNNAAAVMLMLNTFAENKEVVVSRGELVEIGGSFRIPEVMKKAGCKLVEVGSTNRTHLFDYERAINENTGMVLKVHPSNYRISGFTKSVDTKELAKLCEQKNVVFAEDLGSGNIYDLTKFKINDEPKVSESLNSGIKLLSFSGDKLLGVVQCGFIIGEKKYIDLIKQNHLLRALRVDKLVYAAVEKHLSMLLKQEFEKIPVYSMLFKEKETLKKEIEKFLNLLPVDIAKNCIITETKSKIGGGTTPEKEIESMGIIIKHHKLSADKISTYFRSCKTPTIGRIENNNFILDFKTVFTENHKVLAENVISLFKM
jgi:L-seryl-tRNA(Ser) seleniumtransferase